MVLAWKKLTGLLPLPAQRSGLSTRAARLWPLNLPVLRELMYWKYWLARGQKCHRPEKLHVALRDRQESFYGKSWHFL